jgi:hypothetical protein
MKPTKQEMIDKINLVIANKELSFWCRINTKHWNNATLLWIWSDIDKNIWLYYTQDDSWQFYKFWHLDEITKIIWHKVMIWDVLDWISGFWEWGFTVWWDGVIDMWQWQWKFNFRKPIEEQSEECIEYIYSLIQKND